MKILDIALKDLTSSFRSTFLLVFMFGIPLLVTGMFYLMFGGNPEETVAEISKTSIVLVNQDIGDPSLAESLQNQPAMMGTSLGEVIENTIRDHFTAQFDVETTGSADQARQFVDDGLYDLALILPRDLSINYMTPYAQSDLLVYHKPENNHKAKMLQTILAHIIDNIAASRIAIDAALTSIPVDKNTESTLQVIVSEVAAQAYRNNPAQYIAVKPIEEKAQNNLIVDMFAPIMSGMMIFFAFFTGTSTAQTILREAEDGTLARLFTTPTKRQAILSGKLLAVFFTVLIQIIVLIIAAQLIFQINWGEWTSVLIVVPAIVLPAASFGVFVNTLVKSTKQSGPIFGGLLTVTGMIGMLEIFAGGASSETLKTISLLVPQGWSMRAISQSIQGAATADLWFTLLIALAWSLVFMSFGLLRFRKRFA